MAPRKPKEEEVKTETVVTDGPMPEIKEADAAPAQATERSLLEQKIRDLEAELARTKEKVEVAPVPEPAPPKNDVPIPADYRKSVDMGLNSEFGIEMEYSSNSPFFNFSILVPQKYSNAAKPHWDTYHEDRRTRVISNAEGYEGVKQWIERVYNNFDPETKARITSDRVNHDV